MNLCKVYQNCPAQLIDKLRTMTIWSGYREMKRMWNFCTIEVCQEIGWPPFLIKGESEQLNWVGLETIGELSWRLEEERKWYQRLEQSVH